LKRPRPSYETSFRIKVGLIAVVFGIALFMAVYYPLISHEVNPFDVAAPKGRIVIARNLTIGNISYTNAVVMDSRNNLLVLKGNDDAGDTLTMEVITPGWCLDFWAWEGSRGWRLRYNCSRRIEISEYAFRRVPTHEATEILYWYLESGYAIVFHKNGPVENYETVNFTVTYGGDRGEGSFKVALG